MKKTQGRPALSDEQKKHGITCRVSFDAMNYLRSDNCSNISAFIDSLILAFLSAKKSKKPFDMKGINT